MNPRSRPRHLRLIGVLVSSGLFVEALTLHWAHPTAFLIFALSAGLLIGGGALIFLVTLFATAPDEEE